MLAARSHNGATVRLTDERWEHVVRQHPEMGGQRQRVLETLSDPDLIQQGDFGELLAVRSYPRTLLTSKNLVAVYRETNAEDGFVVTAYLTRRPSARRVTIWKRRGS